MSYRRSVNYVRVPRIYLWASVLVDLARSTMRATLTIAAIVTPLVVILGADPSTGSGFLMVVVALIYCGVMLRLLLNAAASLAPDSTAVRSDRYDPGRWSSVRRWTATEDGSMGRWLRRVR